jgi:hypothetical protein
MKTQTKRQGRLATLLIVHCSLLICFFASCTDMFQQKIPFAHSGSSLEDMLRDESEEAIKNVDGTQTDDGSIKLAAPNRFYAASYYSAWEIRLSWEDVQGAAYYRVDRAIAPPVMKESGMDWETPTEDDYEVLQRQWYGTSYADVILKNSTLESPEYQYKYFYRISALNTAKGYEQSDTTEPLSAMLFRAPLNVKASGGVSEEYIELEWEQAPGADSYEIWRSDFPNGVSASSLGTVMGNLKKFRNMVSAAEQGKDFYYMVIAKNGIGNKTLQTKPAYGYARVFGAPGTPEVSLAENSGRGHSTGVIKIKWEPAAEPDAYYAVYRYSSVDSALMLLTDRTEDTEYSDDRGLKPGVFYYYKVQAIVDDVKSGKALKSQFSSLDEQTESYILSPPGNVVAEKKSDNTVTVKWEPAIGTEIERLLYTYRVYSDSRMDGTFTNVARDGVMPVIDEQGFVFVDGLSVDSGAFFKVATVRGDIVSIKSFVVSPSPAAAVILDATQHAFIQGAAENSNGVYPVKITWKKPENEEPAFYHVQRSTKTAAGFSRINETALSANGPWNDVYTYDAASGVYTFIDKNETAKAGRKFYYRVLSLNQLEQGSFMSAEKIGWGALGYEQYMLEYNKTMKSALKKLTYMHKPGSTEKLGKETKNGTISGTILYDGAISGLGARIIIQLSSYADFYIENEQEKGVYFTLTGNSNTSANMSSNGTMDGTVTCTGMYPGRVYSDKIEIKGGAAGGGTYGILPDGFPRVEVRFTVVD